jgi:hypothetical protein
LHFSVAQKYAAAYAALAELYELLVEPPSCGFFLGSSVFVIDETQ